MAALRPGGSPFSAAGEGWPPRLMFLSALAPLEAVYRTPISVPTTLVWGLEDK